MSVASQTSHRIPGTAVSLRAPHALGAAVMVVAAFVGCWYLTFHSVAVAQADAHAYFAFLSLSQDHAVLRHLADAIANVCDTGTYVFLAAVPVIVALLRRRWTLALVIGAMIAGANLSTELLKPVLALHRPAVGVAATPLGSGGSFPSGHATAAMVLGLALVLASSSRWRPYVAVLGTGFALAVMYSVLSLGWHYPSDVLGGILVALTWTLLAVSAILYADARFGRDLTHLSIERTPWLTQMPSMAALLGAAALPVLAVLVWRAHSVLSFSADHASFLAAAIGVAVVGVAAPTTLAMVLSGSDRAARAAHPRR
jgi:membrane-associated phospholipid phosphatase